MANITKVPNGPLIKKKGPFKGSTLKSGGKVKKAQGGAVMTKRDSTVADIKEQTRLRQNLTDFRKKVGSKPLTPELIREKDSLKGLLSDYSTKKRVKGTGLSAEQLAKNDQKLKEKMARKDDVVDEGSIKNNPNKKTKSTTVSGSGILGKLNPFKPGCIYTTEDKSGVKKKNGGPVRKAQTGTYEPKNENSKIKIRSEDGNYKMKIKGDKVVERRTLKGFFSGAPRAAGRMKEAPAGLLSSLPKKETKDSPKDITKNPAAKKQVAMRKPSSFVAPLGKIPMERKSTDTTPVKTKAVMKKGGRVVKAKAGAMIKRADGSMSRRGLWDNIRANKGSGKKPTAAMLKQEKKIKAKTKK